MRTTILSITLAQLAAVPAILLRTGGLVAPVEPATLGFGVAIVGAPFLALSYSAGAGRLAGLPLDERQVGEVLLTAAQSFFGVTVLAWLRFQLRDAALLAGLFSLQLILGGILRAGPHNASATSAELHAFAVLYVVLALWQLWMARDTLSLLRRHAPRRSRSSRGTAARKQLS